MTEPRDDSLDRLLRQTLRQTPEAGATPSCLDAETMAAWMDGGLSGAALAAAEAHTATCPRCRALVAVIVRSQTAEQHPVEVSLSAPGGVRARSWLPWLVPLAAAALIAMAIWIPRREEQPAQESTIAAAPPAETAPQATRSGPIGQRQQTPPPQEEAQAAAAKETRPANAGNARADQAELKREMAAAAPPTAPPVLAPTFRMGSSPPSAAPSPPPAALPPPPAPPTPVAAAPERVVTPAPLVTPAPNAGAPRQTFRTGLETVIAEFQSPDVLAQTAASGTAAGRGAAPSGGGTGTGTAAARGGAGGSGGGARGGAAARTGSAGGIAPPDASQPIRWRVLASGVVERSSPPGTPWEPIAIEPAGARLTNGAAPGPLVCWLVGRNGVVFLTVDGRSFTRILFPETVDLTSVRATSAGEVTVRTTDGRTFATTDGGRTWSRE